MRPEEIAALAADGIDFQLHTHRHRLPLDRDATEREIRDNRAVLAPVARRDLAHFCYPSGEYDARHPPALGIASATTTRPGFNYRDAAPLELSRFLDSEDVSDLEFEAEMCGFFELIRRGLGVRI